MKRISSYAELTGYPETITEQDGNYDRIINTPDYYERVYRGNEPGKDMLSIKDTRPNRPPGAKPSDDALDKFSAMKKFMDNVDEQLGNPTKRDPMKEARKATEMDLRKSDPSMFLLGPQTLADRKKRDELFKAHYDRIKGEIGYSLSLRKDAMTLFAKDYQEKRKYEMEIAKEVIKGQFGLEKQKMIETGKEETRGTNPYDPKDKAFDQWEDTEKQSAAKTKIITGKNPVFAGRDSRGKAAFEQYYNKYINEKGYSPSKVAYIQSKYKSLDTSLKNMTKQEAPMDAFVMNINEQINKVQQIYNEVDRSGVRFIDMPIRELKVKAMGSGKEANLASYLIEISNEIGKLSTGSSASIRELSDSAQKQWANIHDKNLSIKEMMIVLNGTRDQGNLRINTWRKSIDNVRQEMESLLGDSPHPIKQPPQSQSRELSPLLSYINQNKSKYSQSNLYNQMIQSGWTNEEIIQAWRNARGK